MQTLTQVLHNEYIRFTLATALICVAVIVVWLLLRHVRLWYNETGSVLEALDTISYRLEHVEDKLGIANQDTLGISENIYVIGTMTEESRAVQVAIQEDIKGSKENQDKIVREINGIHGLLLADPVLPKEVFPKKPDFDLNHGMKDLGEVKWQDDGQNALHEECDSEHDQSFDECDDDYDDIEELWLEDLEDDFPEEDEDEIRKRIRL